MASINFPSSRLLASILVTIFGAAGLDAAMAQAIPERGEATLTNSRKADTTALQKSSPELGFALRIGGEVWDTVSDIELDDAGNAYVTGCTSSPHCSSSMIYTCGDPSDEWQPAGSGVQLGAGGESDAFLIKVSPQGDVLFRTFLGGTSWDCGEKIALDDAGNIFVAGTTNAFSNFPTTSNAYSSLDADTFLAKIDPTGSSLLYSTFVDGASPGALDVGPCPEGGTCAFLTGKADSGVPTTAGAISSSPPGGIAAFLFVLDPSQANSNDQLIYSTYFGGSSNSEGAGGIAVDAAGRAHITGVTGSSDFPTTANAFQPNGGTSWDSFLTVIDPGESGAAALVYSTYIGGSSTENGTAGDGGIALSATGVTAVTGTTDSADFPVSAEAFLVTNGGMNDAFLVAIDTSLSGAASLLYSSYYGSAAGDYGNDLAMVDNTVILTGSTIAMDLPGPGGEIAPKLGEGPRGSGSDAFFAKFDISALGEASLVDAAYIGGVSHDHAHAVSLDADDNAWIAGDTNSDLPFVPAATGPSSTDVFLARVKTATAEPSNQSIPGILVRKGGTTPVPGREIDYVIIAKNTTATTATNFEIVEYLEPWFEFVSASPPPDSIQQVVVAAADTGLEFDLPLDLALHWSIASLESGENKMISYRAKLAEETPIGMKVVGGPACAEKDSSPCDKDFNKCMGDQLEQCSKIAIISSLPDLISKPLDHLASLVKGIKLGAGGLCHQGATNVCKGKLKTCKDTTFESCGAQLLEGGESSDCCGDDPAPADAPIDPNEKEVLSPTYIGKEESLTFLVHYENVGTTAARDIFVTDVLDQNLDLSTVQVRTGDGSTVALPVDGSVTLLQENRVLQIDVGGELVDQPYVELWEASLDSATRTLSFDLNNIYLAAEAGGSVAFIIDTADGLVDGDEIRNEATIQFEIFDILTTAETLNIVDEIAPTCVVNALPAVTEKQRFEVSWTGSDPVGEISGYRIFASVNGGSETLIDSTTETSTVVTAELGDSLSFYCTATDTAGNAEVQSGGSEANTTIADDVLCPLTPNAGCREAFNSVLLIKERAEKKTKNLLRWVWTRGEATPLSDFGDPNSTTQYAVCLYDGQEGTPVLSSEMRPATDSRWENRRDKLWLYRDRDKTEDGLLLVQLRAGSEGKAKVRVIAKGAEIPMPGPRAVYGPYLETDPAVVVQIASSEGVCWESRFTATDVLKNLPSQYKAKHRGP